MAKSTDTPPPVPVPPVEPSISEPPVMPPPVETTAAPAPKKPESNGQKSRVEPNDVPPSDTDTPRDILLPEATDDDDDVLSGALEGVPSWLTSLAIHLVAILILALWSAPELPRITADLLLSEPSDEEDADLFEDVPDMSLDQLALETEPIEIETQPDTDTIAEEVNLSTFDDLEAAPMMSEVPELALTGMAPSIPADLVGASGAGTEGRGKAARSNLARRFGASGASETAVDNALNWLAAHQLPDGSWTLMHNATACQGRCPNPAELGGYGGENKVLGTRHSATGLALLPYLGAGQTQRVGKHRKTVARGLKALVAMAKADDNGIHWRDRNGSMYAHGISAIALCEAYGMTGDVTLRSAAQASIDYIVYAQSPTDGGWRYAPRSPGDTSVTGWQVMALKSAQLAGLQIPPRTMAGVKNFLDQAQTRGGAQYAYTGLSIDGKLSGVRPSMSSVGLLCRMYMGWKSDNEALVEGAELLAKRGPSRTDYYYNYYASQVLFQYTGGRGPMWREWNRAMRKQLVDQQEKVGHLKGSWYTAGGHSARGGRLYCTAMATMTLEVYYRYLPIYGEKAVTTEFPE